MSGSLLYLRSASLLIRRHCDLGPPEVDGGQKITNFRALGLLNSEYFITFLFLLFNLRSSLPIRDQCDLHVGPDSQSM